MKKITIVLLFISTIILSNCSQNAGRQEKQTSAIRKENQTTASLSKSSEERKKTIANESLSDIYINKSFLDCFTKNYKTSDCKWNMGDLRAIEIVKDTIKFYEIAFEPWAVYTFTINDSKFNLNEVENVSNFKVDNFIFTTDSSLELNFSGKREKFTKRLNKTSLKMYDSPLNIFFNKEMISGSYIDSNGNEVVFEIDGRIKNLPNFYSANYKYYELELDYFEDPDANYDFIYLSEADYENRRLFKLEIADKANHLKIYDDNRDSLIYDLMKK